MPRPIETAIGGQRPGGAYKPSITVQIDGHYTSKVYTSGSSISGQAIIATTQNVSFDFFEILFTGIASTRLDFVQQFPTHTFKSFMKLRMPITEDSMPASRTFEAGKTYTVPFNFIVPHQLTIGACTHHTTSPAVREQHLRLPPTMGSAWESNDQAPDMAKIVYAVKARAIRKNAPGEGQTKLMEGEQVLKVLPALPEDAPLEVNWRDERYTVEKRKTIRKGLFSGKTGKLTATAAQPSAIMLAADGREASTSSARINLSFASTSAENPTPRINSISGKLQAVTYFSATPNSNMPNLGPRANYSTSPSLNYSTSTQLFTKPAMEVAWKQQHVAGARRDSGYSSIGLEDGSSDSDGRGRRGSKAKTSSKESSIRHTASLDVPFTIPTSRQQFFLPTTHSCLISRTYTLQLTLSVGPTNTNMTLSVPLQVGVDTIYEPQGAELPSFDTVLAERAAENAAEEVDALMRPRVMSVPDVEMHRNSMLPGYNEVNGRMISVS